MATLPDIGAALPIGIECAIAARIAAIDRIIAREAIQIETRIDPLGVDGGINVYAFSGDDPVNGSDPSGMVPGDGSDCQAALDQGYAEGEITGSEDLYGCPGLPPDVILVAAPPVYVPSNDGGNFDGGDLPTGTGSSGGPTGAQAQWVFSDVGRRVITMPKIVNCFSAGVATLGTAALDLEGLSALKAGVKEFFTARAAAAVEARSTEWYLGMNARGMQLARSAGRTAAIQLQFAQADATEVVRGVEYGLAGSLPTDGVNWKAAIDAFPGAATASMVDVTREACK